jgi:hypothetical protein
MLFRSRENSKVARREAAFHSMAGMVDAVLRALCLLGHKDQSSQQVSRRAPSVGSPTLENVPILENHKPSGIIADARRLRTSGER